MINQHSSFPPQSTLRGMTNRENINTLLHFIIHKSLCKYVEAKRLYDIYFEFATT